MSAQGDDERKLPPFPKPLNSIHILDALKRSPDAGATIVFSKLGISDIGVFEAEELANAGQQTSQETGSVVERLALGNNRLSSLPPEFSLFTRLRYLNLKHNSFTTFPDVLTLIPSLDTLDLSHNRISKLPPYPGNLARLRVFCLSRNKIARLPLYITQFGRLEVLQTDRNPLEWPPETVIQSLRDVKDTTSRKDWIRSLFNWMEVDASKGREYDDSGYSEQQDWEVDPPTTSWQFPRHDGHFDPGPTPHARSFSIDSNASISSTHESPHGLNMTEQLHPVSYRTGSSPNYIGRSPRELEMATDAVSESSYTQPPQGSTAYDGVADTEQVHSRTKSHVGPRKPPHSFVTGKKSLPDLHNVHEESTKRMPDLPEKMSPTYFLPIDNVPADSSFLPSSSLKDDSSFRLYPATADSEDVHSSDAGALRFIAAERNSYFHRSSTVIVNPSLPTSLLRLHESARGILFAMGQLYQALEHYGRQGLDERISSIFKKVLDPGNVNLLHLIRSLDRFNDVSQKSTPSPAVCRGLVESCRDTVSTFRKAVGILILQIGHEVINDARFVRWLILELYGTTAELSFAWQAMVPGIETLKPFIYGSIFSNSAPFTFGSEPDALKSTTALSHLEDLTPVVRLRPADSSFGTGRARTARRHAGSFSSKDVQIGKELPSYDILPSMAGGLATHTPTLRTPKRLITTPIVTSFISNSPSYFSPSTPANTGHHFRDASQSSLPDSSPIMSPTTLFESQASNKTLVNEEVLHAIQKAVEIAPTVWDQIQDALGNVAYSNSEVRDILEGARLITGRLSRHVFDMSGDFHAGGKVIREDAHVFLKIIVQLSSLLKTHGNPHSVSSTLRSNLVNLTNYSEEFAIQLHIHTSSASFHASRSNSPTTYSKAATYNINTQPLEDNLLSSSLSRFPSAQATLDSVKQSTSIAYDGSSAIALFTSKPPSVRRLRVVRDISSDSSDPG
ncbi:hypothetical protein GALMADRAFT_239473 [Galerina marginata CBS 339.88]|uniref:RAM signaling network component n=1 Tax=Galerina marginata (strain CBS 339.88) TaxID=685588 RepID=A0A067TE75_GALM3|nr:hypothetical protein GALMADRAFT_239473 [Galerina marginata CBS 339.88]